MELPAAIIRETVTRALAEDLGWGDITTDSIVPLTLPGSAIVLAKASGVLCGLRVMAEAFRQIDPSVEFEGLIEDGTALHAGMTVARVTGPAASLLKAERVSLNFIQRLSGIATLAARFVEAVQGTRAQIVDTRKTTPGLRALEKYAVRTGGAGNHRFNLSDGVLIKDNHLAALAGEGDPVVAAVARARARVPHTIRVEVEADTLDQVADAIRAGADIILLDNMDVPTMAEAVRRVAGRALTEASGGVNLATVRSIAETGVDLISVGALTHSAPSLDLSLDLTVGVPVAERG
jgi:nicotinate-nucleotide pyrophosphorylase (carboxylating)